MKCVIAVDFSSASDDYRMSPTSENSSQRRFRIFLYKQPQVEVGKRAEYM